MKIKETTSGLDLDKYCLGYDSENIQEVLTVDRISLMMLISATS